MGLVRAQVDLYAAFVESKIEILDDFGMNFRPIE